MSGWTPILTFKSVQHLRDEETAQFFDSHYKERDMRKMMNLNNSSWQTVNS
jgi:hypothetical protein